MLRGHPTHLPERRSAKSYALLKAPSHVVSFGSSTASSWTQQQNNNCCPSAQRIGSPPKNIQKRRNAQRKRVVAYAYPRRRVKLRWYMTLGVRRRSALLMGMRNAWCKEVITGHPCHVAAIEKAAADSKTTSRCAFNAPGAEPFGLCGSVPRSRC